MFIDLNGPIFFLQNLVVNLAAATAIEMPVNVTGWTNRLVVGIRRTRSDPFQAPMLGSVGTHHTTEPNLEFHCVKAEETASLRQR
jgi:hypothetical protein